MKRADGRGAEGLGVRKLCGLLCLLASNPSCQQSSQNLPIGGFKQALRKTKKDPPSHTAWGQLIPKINRDALGPFYSLERWVVVDLDQQLLEVDLTELLVHLVLAPVAVDLQHVDRAVAVPLHHLWQRLVCTASHYTVSDAGKGKEGGKRGKVDRA